MFIELPSGQTIPIRRQVYEWQSSILHEISRSYVYKNYLADRYEREIRVTQKKTIAHIHGVMLMNFISRWAILFGSENNKVHWKKICDTDAKDENGIKIINYKTFVGIVEKFIHTTSNINQEQYANIRKSTKKVRGKLIAHIDLNNIPSIPNTDMPYEIAKAYSLLLTHAQLENVHEIHWSISDREEFYFEEVCTLWADRATR